MGLSLFDKMGMAEDIHASRMSHGDVTVRMSRFAASALMGMLNGADTTDMVRLCAARKFMGELKAMGVKVED